MLLSINFDKQDWDNNYNNYVVTTENKTLYLSGKFISVIKYLGNYGITGTVSISKYTGVFYPNKWKLLNSYGIVFADSTE